MPHIIFLELWMAQSRFAVAQKKLCGGDSNQQQFFFSSKVSSFLEQMKKGRSVLYPSRFRGRQLLLAFL